MRGVRLSGKAGVVGAHVGKLLSFSGLVALLFVRPHPPVRVLSAPTQASDAELLEALTSGDSVDVVEVGWSVLAGLDVRTGERTELLGRLDGETVRVAGFIVALDDIAAGGAEFLLVPYYGACIHTPPPPPNQMVHVSMEPGGLTDPRPGSRSGSRVYSTSSPSTRRTAW